MSNLPLADITPGHTISEMVDIINRNFDLIDEKGGGPAGIQGIQGINGFPGEQGATGETGPSGTGWVPYTTDFSNVRVGDLTLNENGEVLEASYNEDEGMHWVPTGQTITSLAESPFMQNGSSIHPKQSYVSLKTVLGGLSSTTNAVLNIVSADREAVNIYKSAGGKFASITCDNADNRLHISAKEILLESDGIATLSVKKTGNAINLSPLAGNGVPNNIRQIVSANKEGDIEEQQNWTWGIKGNSIVPNSNLQDKTIGDADNRTDGVFFEENSELNFVGGGNGYLNVTAVPDSGGSGKTVSRFSLYGLSVGENGTQIERNANTRNNGIVIGGGNGKNGHITFLGSSSNSDFVGSETTESPLSSSGVNVPTYTLNINPQQGNAFPDNAPVITVAGSNNNRNSNLLHIKGATMSNMRGADVFVEGGESVGEWNNNYATGGNVYLAGGKNRNTSNVNGGTVSGSLYHFGDVIVGLNPANHPGLRSNGNNRASSRGVSSDDINGLKFYDICNFTAHGNRIILDSDANNRVVNGYDANGYAPNMPYIDQTTLRFNGINTLLTDRPVMITPENAGKHQMVSGVYNVAFMYYMQGGGLKTLRGKSIYELKQSSEFNPSTGGGHGLNGPQGPLQVFTRMNTVFSNIVTNWQKVGNMVSCSTRVDFYYCDQNGTMFIVKPETFGPNLSGMNVSLYALHKILKNGIITNVELPVYLGKNTTTPIRPNYVSGQGFAFTERPIDNSNTENVSPSSSNYRLTNDNLFLVDKPVSVNNNTSYTNPSVVSPYSGVGHDSTTNKHEDNGELTETGNMRNNMPMGYICTDSIFGSGMTLLTPTDMNCAYIVPEYMDELNTEIDGQPRVYRKFVTANKIYTSMTLNYSYLLNQGFSDDEYVEFKYDSGDTSVQDSQVQ